MSAEAPPILAVEEANPDVAVSDASAPAPDAPTVEAAVTPVRLPFLCVAFIVPYFS